MKRAIYITTAIIAAISLLYCGYVFQFIVPKFEQIFKDLNIVLPKSTIWTISLSKFGFGIILWLAALFNGTTWIWWKNENGRIVLSVLLTCACLLVYWIMQMALFQPLVMIIEHINDSGAT